MTGDRFWSKVSGGDVATCWTFTGALGSGGYGVYWHEGRSVSSHRYAYEELVVEIPAGLHIDHLCRNRACVNPWHMDPVPPRVNVLRGKGITAQNVYKTECPRAHPYTPENTLVSPEGKRSCRECHLRYKREYMRLRRSA